MQLELTLADIRPGRFQPRKTFDREKMLGLAESIKAQGLINPIVVFANEAGLYELIAGERRWRASIALAIANRGDMDMGLEAAAALVCERDPAELVEQYFFLRGYKIRAEKLATELEELHQVALVDNIQRHDLSPVEEAQALLALKEAYGYSLRKLAEVTGLTKSYIDDRLKLVSLAPEVSAMITPNGSGPALDLTLARDLARKIPQEMQGAVAGYLVQRQAGAPIGEETTKKGQAAISRVAKFLDPATWELPADRPWPPEIRNRSRVIIHLLTTTPQEQLAAAMVKLDQPANSWESSGYLGRDPMDILDRSQDFWHVVHILTQASVAAVWSSLPATAELGLTCANCQLKDLHGLFGQREADFDSRAPCQRLTQREPETVQACANFIGADDPVVIALPYSMGQWLDDTNGRAEMKKFPGAFPGERHYVDDIWVFHGLYTAARQKKEQDRADTETRKKQGHLVNLRAYWEAQQGDLLAMDNFQAHACRRCAHFIADAGADDIPCQFAREPLRRSYDKTQARAPESGLLVAGSQVVPRCEKFRLAELPAIRPNEPAGFVIPDRDLVLDLFRRSIKNNYYYQDQNKTWAVLQWLPIDSLDQLKKLWKQLDDDRMMTILVAGIRESTTLSSVARDKVALFDPTTGRSTTWKSAQFSDLETVTRAAKAKA